jgi:hypothetical protein
MRTFRQCEVTTPQGERCPRRSKTSPVHQAGCLCGSHLYHWRKNGRVPTRLIRRRGSELVKITEGHWVLRCTVVLPDGSTCQRDHTGKGMCGGHIQRARKNNGDPLAHILLPPPTKCTLVLPGGSTCQYDRLVHGLCHGHAQRLRATGKTSPWVPLRRNTQTLKERADWVADPANGYISINENTQCWEWQRTLNAHGYGQCVVADIGGGAHRMMYRAFVDDDIEGSVIHHKCGVRHCVNPGHLEATTHLSNMAEGHRNTYLELRIAELEKRLRDLGEETE